MKTFQFDGKECFAAAIAFTKETEGWRDKLQCVLFNFAKNGVVTMPNCFKRDDDTLVEGVTVKDVVNKSHVYYLKGVLRLYIPVGCLDSFNRYCANNFKHGPARKGEDEKLDAIFADVGA